MAGTMAELRASHFHGGIDIKTEGRIGFPVYAAADGYVYRVKVSSFGYGKVMYIKHPDGERTVYAHLNAFKEDIEAFMLQKQYEREAFAIDIDDIEANKFPVKRGDVIAYSGNTGSSGGPHLHFEIRNKNDEPINPLYFNFKEITDNISPVIDRVAVQTLEVDSRVNGMFGRATVKPYRSGNTYSLSKPIKALGWVGVEFKGIDRANGTYNKYGINKVELLVNDSLIYKHHLNAIPFGLNRAMHVFTDYPSWELKRNKFQRAYMAEGNPLPIFEDPTLTGRILVEEGESYKVQLKLYDSKGNRSIIKLTLKGETSKAVNTPQTENVTIREDVLKVETPQSLDSATFVFDYYRTKIAKAYSQGNGTAFLWNLTNGLPKEIQLGSKVLATGLQIIVPDKGKFNFYHKNFTIEFQRNSLFDTLYLQAYQENTSLFVHSRTTPLFRAIKVQWTPDFFVDNKSIKRVFTRNRRGRPLYVGGKWNGDTIEFYTGSFGEFFLDEDVEKPSVTLINKTLQQLVFRIDDEISGIENYRAELNGKWLLMKYDHKKKLIRSEIGEEHIAIKGDFKLEVTDAAGNVTEYERRF